MQVSKYDSHIKQLGVGKAGKKGLLQVIFEKRQGKTVVSEQVCESPLYFQKAMYLEQSAPSLAHMYIMSSAGGVLQGDRFRLDISLKQNSSAHITTQGATRIYSMDSNNATQMINIKLDDGAYLEFVSDQIIPYHDSRYYQRLNCSIHDNAVMFYSEIITPGRVAMNESFEYDVCYLKTKVKNQNDKLRFIDIVDLEPKKQKLSVLGILEEFTIMGNVYLFAKKEHVLDIEKQIVCLKPKEKIIFGYSILAYNSGILVRILGNNVQSIQDLILQIVKIVRKNVLDASFSGIRKS